MQNDDPKTFHQDATFCVRDGAVAGTIRLESYNYPVPLGDGTNRETAVDSLK